MKKPIGHELPDYMLDEPEEKEECSYCKGWGYTADEDGKTLCPECNPKSMSYRVRQATKRVKNNG